MAKLFGNLHLVMAIGLVAALALMLGFGAYTPVDSNSVARWLHLFFGVLWIGLLYYLNFVQVPTMPSIPDEQKAPFLCTSRPRCCSSSAGLLCSRW